MRPPDFVIGSRADPYLERWYLIPKNPWFNIYLHHFLRSDDDRALHDHPWVNLSILVRGSYVEHTEAGERRRAAPSIIPRLAEARHRIELRDGPAWTIFITGPRMREWGFWCPNGFIHWLDFVNPNNTGEIGPGCGE